MLKKKRSGYCTPELFSTLGGPPGTSPGLPAEPKNAQKIEVTRVCEKKIRKQKPTCKEKRQV